MTDENKDYINFFAETSFRNKRQKFGIKTDDRRRHTYIIGKTGMGKTNMLENMVYSDIINGAGVCYVDPHGDTAEKILNFIPSYRVNDVVYFNPADFDAPIAFNVLESVDATYKHLVSSGLIAVFKKIWADSWGPRLEYILRNCFLALLDHPDSTLLGVPRMLVDKEYRKKVVKNVKDPVVKSFWINEFTKFNERTLAEVISPIQNKVGQFLSTALIRNIVGQVRSTIDMRSIMDDRKILILNLSKGRIGEDASSLLGSMIITKIQLAAMSRVNIPENERADFYLYVDEFQNFANAESFAGILSEARKYHLNLIMAHQYIGQLDEKVANAVFGNVGTIITFRVGAQDAEFLVKEFTPFFVEEDIVNLPKYNIYLKLMINGVASNPFSAVTLPPLSKNENNQDTIIKISRERYARSRVVVEDKIMRWSGLTAETEKEKFKGAFEGEDSRPAPKTFRDNYAAPPFADKKVNFLQRMEIKKRENFTDFKTKDVMPVKKSPLPDNFSKKEIKEEKSVLKKEVTEVKRPEQTLSDPLKVKPKTALERKQVFLCNSCKKDVYLNFLPKENQVVYCRDCMKKRKNALPKEPLQTNSNNSGSQLSPELKLQDLMSRPLTSFHKTKEEKSKTVLAKNPLQNKVKHDKIIKQNDNSNLLPGQVVKF